MLGKVRDIVLNVRFAAMCSEKRKVLVFLAVVPERVACQHGAVEPRGAHDAHQDILE